jgi:hypothetical protein
MDVTHCFLRVDVQILSVLVQEPRKTCQRITDATPLLVTCYCPLSALTILCSRAIKDIVCSIFDSCFDFVILELQLCNS